MLIKLSELKNLVILDKNNSSSKERRNILNAIACILSEFVIAYLKIDITDDKIFPYIRNHFNGEINSDYLINKLLQEEELKQIFNFIPILKDRKFNENEWLEICEKICIDINDSGKSNVETTYLIFENKYVVKKTFFSIISKDGSFYAQKYLYDSENQKYYFQTIGNEEDLIENSNPSFFYNNINANKEEKTINFTDDEFFKMDQMLELSEDQKSSIRASVDKNLLVLAGAGSGKTRSLVSRLAYLHLVLGIPLNRVILLTFTRNASESMRHKAEELIKEIYLRFDKKEEPHVYAKTIDAFFLKLILDYYPEFGFTDKPQVNVDDGFKSIRNSYIKDIIEKNHMYGILRSNTSLDEIYEQMIDNVGGIAVKRTGFSNLFDFYLEKQIENNCLLDFTSINYIVKNIISNNTLFKKIIIDRYACILIDEFQDINHLQNEVLELLYSTKTHFSFVGDDDQSIYGWRGADVSIIKKIAKMSETNTKYLLINYRNNPNIVNAGNDILKQIEDRAKNKEIIPNKKTGEKIRFSINDYRYTNIADEVKRLHNNGHQYKEFSILTRTNKQIGDIANSLRAINVPIIIRNVPIKLDNYYYLLKALICIKSELDVYNQTNIIIEIAKLNEVTNNAVNEAICNNGKCSGNLQIIQYIAKQMFSGEEKELYKIIEKFSSAAAVEFKKIINGNLDNETIEAIIEYSRDCEIPWPVSHKQLKSFFTAFEKKKNQKIKVNNKTNAVTISTIHGAKGLEYNIVMMIGLNDGEYPDVSKIEDKYQKSLKDLEQIKNARTEYNTIKSLNNENTINDLIQETQLLFDCEETEKAAKSLEIYIKENKNGLKLLKIEEIEEYIDLFKKEILPKEEEFKRQVSINNKEILEYNDKLDRLKERLELYKHGNELANETNKNDKKNFDLNNFVEKINECNEQIEKQEARKKEKTLQLELLQNNYEIFKNKIIKLRLFYNTAVIAHGYLIDMQREYEIESLKSKLEEEKKNQINEEKRTFYVAVTRAKDFLYLFTDENKRQSEFLDIINNNYKVDYKVMTKNEQDEFERLSNSLKEEFKKPEQYINSDRVVAKTNEIISSDLFKKGITEKYKNFLIENPWCSDLPDEVSEFFKQGICLQFVSELTGKTFYAEIAHNFKKAAETILEISAGSNAKPYITVDKEVANNIIITVRSIVRNFGCSVPSYQFIENLISENLNKEFYVDRLDSLKNASIQHFIVRSKKFNIEDSIVKTWENRTFYGEPEQFLKVALILANMRNTLEHEKDEDKWPDDAVTIMLNCLKEIFTISYKSIKGENITKNLSNLKLINSKKTVKRPATIKNENELVSINFIDKKPVNGNLCYLFHFHSCMNIKTNDCFFGSFYPWCYALCNNQIKQIDLDKDYSSMIDTSIDQIFKSIKKIVFESNCDINNRQGKLIINDKNKNCKLKIICVNNELRFYTDADKFVIPDSIVRIGARYGIIEAFFSCLESLEEIIGVHNICTSSNKSFSHLFYKCNSLKTIDVSKWDTRNVIDMSRMFAECSSLKKINVSKWNVSKTTTMNSMFDGCNSLEEIDVSKWDTRNVKDMNYMFARCNSLKTIDASNWNTTNVIDMSRMFAECSSLEEIDVSQWNTMNVKHMKYMFFNCLEATVISNRDEKFIKCLREHPTLPYVIYEW